MSDFEPPSFSLGLEFDLDAPVLPEPSIKDSSPPEESLKDSLIADVADPTPLKRLRRGPKANTTPIETFSSLSEDIEDFSDSEVADISGKQCHSLASSSKLPLHGNGVLISQPTSRLQLRKAGYVPHSTTSENIGSNSKKIMSDQKSMSPVRRFQLIDSDSDDSFLDDMVTKDVNQFVLPAKSKQSNLHRYATVPKKEIEQAPAVNMSGTEDLWKGFVPENGIDIPTPAFDEVCKEFFSSVNDKNPIQNKSGGCSQTSNFCNKRVQQFNQNPESPAHSYFFHDDPKIQKLVRERLPNFSPLGATTSQEYQHQDAAAFDYISQFGNGKSSSVAGKYPTEVMSTKGRKNTRKAKGSGIIQEPENWVNPKRSSVISEETGQRRISAGENSAGHWFTNAEGRKVYITKTGQEMTGQQAYRNYKKDNGAGYKKSKKKSTNKKKTAAKKK